MTKRWSLVLGLALITAPLVAAGPPVKRAAESETVVADVSARNAERAELHRSLEARELAERPAAANELPDLSEHLARGDTFLVGPAVGGFLSRCRLIQTHEERGQKHQHIHQLGFPGGSRGVERREIITGGVQQDSANFFSGHGGFEAGDPLRCHRPS